MADEHEEPVEFSSESSDSESDVQSMSGNLQPLEGAASVVWKFFGFEADNDGRILVADKRKRRAVTCKRCKKKLKYTGGTSNLHFHLREHHRSEYEGAVQASTEEMPQCSMKRVVSAPGTPQITIQDSLAKAIPLPHNSERYKKLTKAVCYFICKDQQPFDTINDSGFRHVLRVFEPRYTPPDRKTIALNHIPTMYDAVKADITKQIADDVQYFSITTDWWSSRARHSYIAVTLHYLTVSFEMRSHLVETKEFAAAHTGELITEALEEVLPEWNLSHEKLVAATTDNGSNLVRAMDLLSWTRISCFSHTIQLAIEKVMDIPRVSRAVAHCKQLVGHFNHSSKSSYLLKQKQYDLKHKQHRLIQSVATRWNSSYYMMERILEQHQPLSATLSQL